MGRPSKGTYLKQRPNGFWYIVWPNNSRGQSTGTRDRSEAEQAFAAFIVARDELDPETGADRLTVSDALDIYIEEHVRPRKKLAGRIVQGDWQAIIKADFLRAHFGSKAIADLVDDDFINPETGYIAMRCAGKVVRTEGAPVRTCEPYSVRRDLGVLVSAIAWCAKIKDPKTGRKRLDPKHIPHIPLPPEAPKRERWLTRAEEAQLLAAVPASPEGERLTRIHRFMVLAVEDGARCEAIEELTWFQVDFRAGTVDYRKPGGSAQHNKRRAKVKMTSRSRAMLERAWRERTGPFVLDHPGSIRTSFETAVRNSGLQNVSPHVLRHTWATRAMQNRVPPQEIADQLADDIRTIMRNYYHHSPDHLQEASSWRDREAGREFPANKPPIASGGSSSGQA